MRDRKGLTFNEYCSPMMPSLTHKVKKTELLLLRTASEQGLEMEIIRGCQLGLVHAVTHADLIWYCT